MKIAIPYGSTELTATLDWARILDTLRIADAPALANPAAAMLEQFNGPIGTAPLATRLQPGGTVLIIVSDSFRKTGVHQLLPTLVAFLNDHGVPDERISFLFATGSHRPPTNAEKSEILGSAIHARFEGRAVAHSPHDDTNLVYRGDTSRGTPVFMNRLADEADTVIATGRVVLHYFGGFGGGRKSILPGIAGMKTIAANHALNLDPVENHLNPDVAIGRLDGNPVAEDMLEGAKRCGDHFLLNTVLNRSGQIARIYCGDLEEAHREACNYAERLYTVPVREKADFVVASAGTAKNFIQSHKSLYNAHQIVKKGGHIILAAPAPEGYGGHKFVDWLKLGSRAAIIAELRKNAEINGQTALSTLEKARKTFFITAMSSTETEALGGQKVENLDEGLDRVHAALAQRGIAHPTCYIMPDAAFSVPILSSP